LALELLKSGKDVVHLIGAQWCGMNKKNKICCKTKIYDSQSQHFAVILNYLIFKNKIYIFLKS
jgi:hypothetical protein